MSAPIQLKPSRFHDYGPSCGFVNESTQSTYNYPRVLIVIPALNEADTIAEVISDVKKESRWDVLVINDRSIDSTATEALRAGATVITPHIRHKAWGATQIGLRYAATNNFDFVVTMDADGQHLAKYLNDLAAPVLKGESDVSIGTCTSRCTAMRHFAWDFFRKLSGISFADPTSGFRAYNRSAIEVLLSQESTMLSYQDFGVLILLKNARKSVSEVEVPMLKRANGISRIYCSWLAVAMYVAQTFLVCVSKSKATVPSGRE